MIDYYEEREAAKLRLFPEELRWLNETEAPNTKAGGQPGFRKTAEYKHNRSTFDEVIDKYPELSAHGFWCHDIDEAIFGALRAEMCRTHFKSAVADCLEIMAENTKPGEGLFIGEQTSYVIKLRIERILRTRGRQGVDIPHAAVIVAAAMRGWVVWRDWIVWQGSFSPYGEFRRASK